MKEYSFDINEFYQLDGTVEAETIEEATSKALELFNSEVLRIQDGIHVDIHEVEEEV